MRNFRKFISVFLLVFAFVLASSIYSFAEDVGEEKIEEQVIGGEEEKQTAEGTDNGEKTEADTEKSDDTVLNADNAQEGTSDGFSEYAEKLVEKVTSSSFVAAIVSFISGVVAILFMNTKSSSKILGFIGEKADSALVKKEFKAISEQNSCTAEQIDELKDTVKQFSVALMLIAEYLPSVPSTVKGELFKNFSNMKDSGKNILDSLKETKEKIEEAVSSIPEIDTSAIAKVLTDLQKNQDGSGEGSGEFQQGTIDLG